MFARNEDIVVIHPSERIELWREQYVYPKRWDPIRYHTSSNYEPGCNDN